MATFMVREVVEATSGQVVQAVADQHFSGVCTDTRGIEAGCLFLALRGENFDGHNFVTTAFERGAIGAIVEEDQPEYHRPGIAIFVVKDTLVALQQLARYHRRRFSIPLIAITGSNGKTTTKDMIGMILAQRYCVLKTEKNFNNEIGLSLTLLQLTEDHEVCVVEMGMRGAGQIKALANIAEPTIAVVTNVGTSHIELLGSQEQIAAAKRELIEALPPTGIAILNYDDSFVWAMSGSCKGKCISYGIESSATIYGSRIVYGNRNIKFNCRCFDEHFDVNLPMAGIHNVYNALAAIAVGRVLGLCGKKLQNGLSHFGGTPMRQELVDIGGITFINDAYNANPLSMERALHVLCQVGKKRKIAVLGDMLELGEWAENSHTEIGVLAAKAKLDAVVTVGHFARYIASAAAADGVPVTYSTDSHRAAYEYLKKMLVPGDTVLLKGSRGMTMEKVLSFFERK